MTFSQRMKDQNRNAEFYSVKRFSTYFNLFQLPVAEILPRIKKR